MAITHSEVLAALGIHSASSVFWQAPSTRISTRIQHANSKHVSCTNTVWGEMHMKLCGLVFLLLASAFPVVGQDVGKTSPAAFKQMQALAGDWEGKDAGGMSAKTNFKVVVAKTTVMETLEM